MNCRVCRNLLLQHLDTMEDSLPAAVERHLLICSECTELQVAARRLEEGLRLGTNPVPPADLTQRIINQVCAERGRSRRRWRRRLTLALAASLLLAVSVWLSGILRGRLVSVGAPGSGPPHPVAQQEQASAPLRDSVDEAGQAMTALTARAADETVRTTGELLPRVTPPSLSDLELTPALDPPARSLREAGSQVSAGLEPVTNSFQRAVGMFLRELPPLEPETKGGL